MISCGSFASPGALTEQYVTLLKTENVEIVFLDDAVDAFAEFAFQVNQSMQNIGTGVCTLSWSGGWKTLASRPRT